MITAHQVHCDYPGCSAQATMEAGGDGPKKLGWTASDAWSVLSFHLCPKHKRIGWEQLKQLMSAGKAHRTKYGPA